MHSSEELGTDVRKPPLCRMCPACPVPTHSREHCRQRGLSAGSQIKAAGKSCFFPEALGRGQQCSVLFPMSLRSYCVPRALLMRVCDHPPLMHRSARGHLQSRHCACSAWAGAAGGLFLGYSLSPWLVRGASGCWYRGASGEHTGVKWRIAQPNMPLELSDSPLKPGPWVQACSSSPPLALQHTQRFLLVLRHESLKSSGRRQMRAAAWAPGRCSACVWMGVCSTCFCRHNRRKSHVWSQRDAGVTWE